MEEECLEDLPCQEFDIGICQTSNIGIESDGDLMFYEEATLAADKRRERGFDAEGKPGGDYDENNPPEGKICGGFLKGNVGILWKDAKNYKSKSAAKEEVDESDSPGYCAHCGYSFYHYADRDCPKSGGPRHPKFKGPPPPSFADANR